jgi:hypothetical protein
MRQGCTACRITAISCGRGDESVGYVWNSAEEEMIGPNPEDSPVWCSASTLLMLQGIVALCHPGHHWPNKSVWVARQCWAVLYGIPTPGCIEPSWKIIRRVIGHEPCTHGREPQASWIRSWSVGAHKVLVARVMKIRDKTVLDGGL